MLQVIEEVSYTTIFNLHFTTIVLVTLFSTIISLETTIVVFQILARRIKSLTFINELILSLNAEIIIQESRTLRLQLGIPSLKVCTQGNRSIQVISKIWTWLLCCLYNACIFITKREITLARWKVLRGDIRGNMLWRSSNEKASPKSDKIKRTIF